MLHVELPQWRQLPSPQGTAAQEPRAVAQGRAALAAAAAATLPVVPMAQPLAPQGAQLACGNGQGAMGQKMQSVVCCLLGRRHIAEFWADSQITENQVMAEINGW
jgi:hypothetical protein